mgnify:CR=1 FL=1|tara:strand:+ start:230 stop:958 length:729 start_codon:yes stop_codon:yes gene_type:complete
MVDEKIIVVLTQYKRNHLKKQLELIKKQSVQPDYLIVFQNENHVDIEPLKKEFDFIHIKSDYNTKFFGRFAACFTFPVDICMVFDDDIMPNHDTIKHYSSECLRLNGIVGHNCRYSYLNNSISERKRRHSLMVRRNQEADFVGHLWCFKKDWLYYMFSIKPFTYDTGEDMHLCYSCKIRGGIKSYLCSQPSKSCIADNTDGTIAADKFSSYITTPKELRVNVERYFVENFGLETLKSINRKV